MVELGDDEKLQKPPKEALQFPDKLFTPQRNVEQLPLPRTSTD
jgi:hypothetical protein